MEYTFQSDELKQHVRAIRALILSEKSIKERKELIKEARDEIIEKVREDIKRNPVIYKKMGFL